jgi:hypothetical protein
MPSKSWFVQIYTGGGKPKAPMVFTDPEKVWAFIDEFKKLGSHDTVAVIAHAVASGFPARVRRMASKAPIARRRAVSTTERMSA